MPLVPVLSSCAHPIQEFTLGSVAPRFSTCKARYSAERSYLQLELGMDLTTAGMQAVVRPAMSSHVGAVVAACKGDWWAEGSRRGVGSPPAGADGTNHAAALPSSPTTPQITPKMKETGLTTRVKFSHLSIKGRVLLGLQLGSAPPGIT